MQQAELSLNSARLLLGTEDASSAISRAYYACFDAARAVLEEIIGPDATGIKTHSGLIRVFGHRVIKVGRMSVEAGAVLSRAQDLRLMADYGRRRPSIAEAEEAVTSAEQFVAICRSLIEREKPS